MLSRHDGGAHRGLRTDHKAAHHLCGRDIGFRQDRRRGRHVAHRHDHGREPRALPCGGRRDAEMPPIGRRIHHLDGAARRRDRDAARCGEQLALARESREKDVMVARILGDQDDADDAARRVGMRLECRVPEILRKMLLAYRKAGAGRGRIARESEREADRHWRPVGPLSLALEAQRLRGRDAGIAKQI